MVKDEISLKDVLEKVVADYTHYKAKVKYYHWVDSLAVYENVVSSLILDDGEANGYIMVRENGVYWIENKLAYDSLTNFYESFDLYAVKAHFDACGNIKCRYQLETSRCGEAYLKELPEFKTGDVFKK